MKIQKKNIFFWGGVGGGGRGVSGRGRVGGGQVGCERRIEVFVKIQKKNLGGGSGGGGSVRRGLGWGGGVGGAGVRVDVNAMFGVGVMWGMGDVNQG